MIISDLEIDYNVMCRLNVCNMDMQIMQCYISVHVGYHSPHFRENPPLIEKAIDLNIMQKPI